MILVITIKEKNKVSGRGELIVSHGIDIETDEVITLPCVPPEQLGALFNADIGEYIIN